MRNLRAVMLPLLLVGALSSCDRRDPPTAGGSDASEFVLELRWLGEEPSPAIVAQFETAAGILRQTITGPLTAVALPPEFKNIEECDASLTGFPDIPSEVVPGLIIYLRTVFIDGAGGTLGSAGPCIVRGPSQNFLPMLGVIRLDAADVNALSANGFLIAVVLHEMLHVAGFGTIWTDNDLLQGAGSADARFLGTRARAACLAVHNGGAACENSVPVHSMDGIGSRDTHWRESTFDTELMTPFISAVRNPFSEMTIRSLADLGYVVSTALADTFTVPTAPALRAASESAQTVHLPEPTRPRWMVGADGALVPFPRQ